MDWITGIEDELKKAVQEKLDTFNQGKSADKGRYCILLPHEKQVYYTLWFYNPAASYHSFVFLELLELNLLSSLNKAMRLLANSYRQLALIRHTDQLFTGLSGNGDDIITFGKYKGHCLQEIYTIDPRYIGWLADKYEPRVKNAFRFKELAVTYNQVHLDLHTPRKYKAPIGRYTGRPGERLTNFTLTVIRVRIEDDPYKSSVVAGTPYFYVDQRIVAADDNGNLFVFTVKAPGRSLQSRTLSIYSHPYRTGEKVEIASAKVLKHFESKNSKYTKLGYLKFKSDSPEKE